MLSHAQTIAIVAISAFTLWPKMAFSASTCSVLNKLKTIEYAAASIRDAKTMSSLEVAQTALSDHLGDISAEELQIPGLFGSQDKLEGFLASRQSFLDLSRMDRADHWPTIDADMQPATPIFDLLRRNACNITVETHGAAGGEARIEGRAETVMAARSFASLPVTGLSALLLILGSSAPFVYRRYRANKFRRLRRAARFACSVSLQVRRDGWAHDATMHDVSEVGGKIEVDYPLMKGDEVEVFVLDAWRSGRIAWANTHFVGIEFLPKLGEKEVLEIVGKRRWQARIKDLLVAS